MRLAEVCLGRTKDHNCNKEKVSAMIFQFRFCPAGAGLAAAGVLAAAGLNAKAELMYGLSDQLDQLVSFDSANPEVLKSAIAITGLANNEQLRGIDWVNGTLYGLGDQSHLYTINPGTGFCTPVGPGFSPILNGIDFGFNTGPNPTIAYVASDLGQSLSINLATGLATVLPSYTGASLDTLAYNFVTGAFIGVSADNHDVYSVNPATGATSLIGSSGFNFLDRIGLAVSPSTDVTFFSGTVGGQSELFTVNTTTGVFSLVGDIGTPGELTSGLDAIAATGITTVPEPGSLALLAAGGGLSLMIMRRRRQGAERAFPRRFWRGVKPE